MMITPVGIKLEGISGFSTCLVFSNDDVRLSLGGNGRIGSESCRVATMDLQKLGVDIVGGPEFVAKAEACKTEDDKLDGDKLFALGFATLLDHFREDQSAFTSMIKAIEKDAFERGSAAAKSMIRNALGIVDRGASVFHEFGEDE